MKTIHRNNQFHYSLCGIRCNADELTINDIEVNCTKCKDILMQFQYSDTNTDVIARFKIRKWNGNDTERFYTGDIIK